MAAVLLKLLSPKLLDTCALLYCVYGRFKWKIIIIMLIVAHSGCFYFASNDFCSFPSFTSQHNSTSFGQFPSVLRPSSARPVTAARPLTLTLEVHRGPIILSDALWARSLMPGHAQKHQPTDTLANNRPYLLRPRCLVGSRDTALGIHKTLWVSYLSAQRAVQVQR